MNESDSCQVPTGVAIIDPASGGGGAAGEGGQTPQGAPGSPLPATGPIVLDASFVIALLQRDPGATALAHVLPRGVMTSVTAGEVFAAVAETGGADPERVEGVLRALGVRIVDLPLAATRQFPWLQSIDSARLVEEGPDNAEAAQLSLADLCVLGYAMTVGLPIITGNRYWVVLQRSALSVPVHFYQHCG